jgi:hypothetical protein
MAFLANPLAILAVRIPSPFSYQLPANNYHLSAFASFALPDSSFQLHFPN